jgi:hypothetical protein
MSIVIRPYFETFGSFGLVQAYNDIARELRSVYGMKTMLDRKGFRSKAAGVAECDKLWAMVQGLKSKRGIKVTEDMINIPDLPTVPAAKPKAKRAGTKKGPPKAAKAKKVTTNGTGHRGRAPLYADSAKVKALSKDDPTREGTSSREYWNLVKSSKTFGDYRTAGGSLKYLYWFVERGHASIV